MVWSLPRMKIRNALIGLYGLVWAAVIIIKQAQGEAVNLEMLGWLAAGIVVIRLAFRDEKPNPPGDNQ